MNNFKIIKSAYQSIKESVGVHPCESGGILLGNRNTMIIEKFIYDDFGSKSHAAYDPDTEFLNSVIKEEWAKNKLELIGFVHSHPRGLSRLSGDYGNNTGDIGYLKAIFNAISDLKFFYVPLVFSDFDHQGFQFFPFIAEKTKEENYQPADLQIIDDKKFKRIKKKLENKSSAGLTGLIDESRLKGSVNLELMANSTVLGIGVGGALGIYENLVRSGLRNIKIVDFDIVDASNITTQGYFNNEIGDLKVNALKNRLLSINPKVNIEAINYDFNKYSEKEIQSLVNNVDLILMMTDNFYAQARGNRMAIKYNVPAIFAMMYEKARCSEVMFEIPGVTPACFRCAVSPRYQAYLEEDFENDVNSVGSTIFHTQYLNSVIGMIALAVLHNKTSGVEFSNWFGSYCDRNFVQVRTHPLYGKNTNNLFDRTYGSIPQAFNFDSIWQRIEPEANKQQFCQDCGGTGNLLESEGKILNSRINSIKEQKKSLKRKNSSHKYKNYRDTKTRRRINEKS